MEINNISDELNEKIKFYTSLKSLLKNHQFIETIGKEYLESRLSSLSVQLVDGSRPKDEVIIEIASIGSLNSWIDQKLEEGEKATDDLKNLTFRE